MGKKLMMDAVLDQYCSDMPQRVYTTTEAYRPGKAAALESCLENSQLMASIVITAAILLFLLSEVGGVFFIRRMKDTTGVGLWRLHW